MSGGAREVADSTAAGAGGLTPDERILVDLVSTPSVSGTERAAAEIFVRHASELGMDAEIDEVGNALAHRGPNVGEADIHIVLLGHIDTVQGEIPVRIEDGVLHGRGSVDAKGPLAAMLCAATRAQLPLGVRLTVAGAVGEETSGSPGARFLATQYRPDACIIGEPSGWDGVTLGYKGRLLATATTTRPDAHSASDQYSPGDLVTAWWMRVLDLVNTSNTGKTGAFNTIQATIQRMSSGSDGLHATASLEAGFRLPVGVSPAELASQLRAIAPEHVTITIRGEETAYATDRNGAVVRALSCAIRENGARPRPKHKTGTADLNVVGPAWNCPIAAYGPGDSSLDHTPEERLSFDEYRDSIRVLTHAIETLSAELAERAHEAATITRAGNA